MSEESQNKKHNVEVYKENTTISVDLPVEFVKRFNELMFDFIPFKDEEHFIEVMKNISEKKFDEPFAYHVSTIFAFLNTVEEAARKQDKLHWIEYDSETNKITPVDKKEE